MNSELSKMNEQLNNIANKLDDLIMIVVATNTTSKQFDEIKLNELLDILSKTWDKQQKEK